MNNEPVVTYVSIGAVVAAVLQVVIASGVNIPDPLVQAILQLVALLVPLIVAAFAARSKVSPTNPTR